MPHAMTPTEAPTPPRKASWKRWAVAVACVLVLAAVTLFLKAPTSEPVSISFVGSTNDNGQKKLIFQGMNRTDLTIHYWVFITNAVKPSYTSSRGAHLPIFAKPGVQGPISTYGDSTLGLAYAGATFTFRLAAPEKGPAWRLGLKFAESERFQTRWENFRYRCADFLFSHKMTWLAVRIEPVDVQYYTPWTEVKE